jgi:WD40 repeat protein
MESASRSCRVHNLDLKREAVSASVFVQILAYVVYTRLIWNLCLSGKSAIQHALHSHYRAITDINWHTKDPDVVVSTGIDSWLWAWDLRTPQKPIMGQSISTVTSYSCLTVFFARSLRFQWYVSSASMMSCLIYAISWWYTGQVESPGRQRTCLIPLESSAYLG